MRTPITSIRKVRKQLNLTKNSANSSTKPRRSNSLKTTKQIKSKRQKLSNDESEDERDIITVSNSPGKNSPDQKRLKIQLITQRALVRNIGILFSTVHVYT